MEFNNQEITNLWISPQIISNCFSFPDFVTFLTLVLFGDFMEKRDKSENKDGKKKKVDKISQKCHRIFQTKKPPSSFTPQARVVGFYNPVNTRQMKNILSSTS
jgi:hypothetical protein